jgi:cell division GTPase FtsZ
MTEHVENLNVTSIEEMEWQDNSFLNMKDIKLSLRLGFMGLGMGGCSIAAACADRITSVSNTKFPYTSLLVNTNSVDLDKINIKNKAGQKKLIIGDGKGAARNTEYGLKLFMESEELVKKEIQTQFSDSDFVFVVAGLGGGTGTGSIMRAIKALLESGFQGKIGLIITLPRNAEGYTVINNALERFETILELKEYLGGIIAVDNDKLYTEYLETNPKGSVDEYIVKSNEFIANTLHELNIVTASFTPKSSTHFDSSEFLKVLQTPGFLHLSRFALEPNLVDTDNRISYATQLAENINKGVLSTGYKLSVSTRAAISIIANQSTANRVFNHQFMNELEKIVDNIVPAATEKPVAEYAVNDKNLRKVHFFALMAGLELPRSRSEALLNEAQRLAELLVEKKNERESENLNDLFKSFKAKKQTLEEDLKTSSNNINVADMFNSKSQEEKPKKSALEAFNDIF